MRCRKAQEYISRSVDGELAGRESARLERHLACVRRVPCAARGHPEDRRPGPRSSTRPSRRTGSGETSGPGSAAGTGRPCVEGSRSKGVRSSGWASRPAAGGCRRTGRGPRRRGRRRRPAPGPSGGAPAAPESGETYTLAKLDEAERYYQQAIRPSARPSRPEKGALAPPGRRAFRPEPGGHRRHHPGLPRRPFSRNPTTSRPGATCWPPTRGRVTLLDSALDLQRGDRDAATGKRYLKEPRRRNDHDEKHRIEKGPAVLMGAAFVLAFVAAPGPGRGKVRGEVREDRSPGQERQVLPEQRLGRDRGHDLEGSPGQDRGPQDLEGGHARPRPRRTPPGDHRSDQGRRHRQGRDEIPEARAADSGAATPSTSPSTTRSGCPRQAAVEVKSVSGDVNVAPIGGKAKIDCVSGNVDLLGAAGADVELVSGELTLENIAGDAYIKAVSGDIGATRIKGSVEVEAVSGDIGSPGRLRGPDGQRQERQRQYHLRRQRSRRAAATRSRPTAVTSG